MHVVTPSSFRRWSCTGATICVQDVWLSTMCVANYKFSSKFLLQMLIRFQQMPPRQCKFHSVSSFKMCCSDKKQHSNANIKQIFEIDAHLNHKSCTSTSSVRMWRCSGGTICVQDLWRSTMCFANLNFSSKFLL